MLRDSALKIIRALKIEGGCNVQFALDPNSMQYYLIEVNPRVSRSSALASKASGYPKMCIRARVWRQPFPGPGLAVRVIGAVTEEKLALLRDADAIFREEIGAAGLEEETNQYFAVLTDLRSVGVMGDERTYDYTLALRAVQSQDFMTATWSRLPYDLLDKVSNRIVGEVKHINRICYDITSKPPATVEWE